MNLQTLYNGIENHKKRSPETFDEIMRLSVLFHSTYNKLYTKECALMGEMYHLNNTEIDVLATIKLRGDEDFIITPTKLSDALLFITGSITKILNKLEQRGYIKRVQNIYDKRSKLVQLTPKGLKLTNEALKKYAKLEREFFSPLNGEQKEHLKEILSKLLS